MIEGHCTCRAVAYRFEGPPLVVHCCHCRWCQRETGTAFALNALIETGRMVMEGEVDVVDTPTLSGRGQRVARCPSCRVALWSNYGPTDNVRFVRVGTLEDPDAAPPDVHIFVASKQPWVVLPEGARAYPEFYPRREDVWRPESLERLATLRARALTPAR